MNETETTDDERTVARLMRTQERLRRRMRDPHLSSAAPGRRPPAPVRSSHRTEGFSRWWERLGMSLRRWVLLTLAAILLWSVWALSGAGIAQGAAPPPTEGELAVWGGP